MDKKFEQLINNAKSVRLDDGDRSAVRRNLVALAGTNPLPGRIPSWRFGMFSVRPALIALGILLVTGTAGAAWSAQKSLPGDLLYPVKVGLNESIRGALAVSEDDEIDWELAQIGLRLDEEEQLAESFQP